ncbi:MAG: hypothetical protein AAF939_14940 [Planctomycetota bacterium]
MDQALLAAKLKHAEQLRQQMIRVEREQGAGYGFAANAFKAQQNYLAETAYEEYLAYQKFAQNNQSQNQSGQLAAMRQPSVSTSSQFSRQARNLNQEVPANSQRASNGLFSTSTLPSRIPVQSNGVQSPTSAAQAHNHQYSGGPVRRYASADGSASRYAPPVHIPPQANGYRAVPQKTERTVRQSVGTDSRYAQRRNPVNMSFGDISQSASSPQPAVKSTAPKTRTQRIDPPKNPKPQTGPVSNNQNPFQRDRYILDDPNAELQDKIAGLLSKPRYQKTSRVGSKVDSDGPAKKPTLQSNPKAKFSHRKQPNKNARPKRQQWVQNQSNFLNTARSVSAKRLGSSEVVAGTRVETTPERLMQSDPVPSADLDSFQLEIEEPQQSSPRLARRQPPKLEISESRSDLEKYSKQLKSSPQVTLNQPKLDMLDRTPIAPVSYQQNGRKGDRVSMPQMRQEKLQVKSQASSDTMARVARQEFGTLEQVSVLTGRQETGRPDTGGGQFPTQPPRSQPGQDRDSNQFDRIDERLRREMNDARPGAQENQNFQPSNDMRKLETMPPTQDDSQIAEGIDRMNDELDRQIAERENQSDRRPRNAPIEKSCDEFRRQLLADSIRDIPLDLSPPASAFRDEYAAISRSWTDRAGNIIATGKMVDLRRGYVIIESGQGLLKLPYGRLSDADYAAIAEYWRIPASCTVGGVGTPYRAWVPQTYTWKATNLCHKPLYFENIQLERYGHTHGPFLQPVHSVAHFFTSMFTLPYQTAINPPNECQYALGFYRPGNCAPWLKPPVPISLSGLRRQALITTGLGFIP